MQCSTCDQPVHGCALPSETVQCDECFTNQNLPDLDLSDLADTLEWVEFVCAKCNTQTVTLAPTDGTQPICDDCRHC